MTRPQRVSGRADTPQQQGRPSRRSGCGEEGGLHPERLQRHLPPPSAEPAFCPLPTLPSAAPAAQAGPRRAPSPAGLTPLLPPLPSVHAAAMAEPSAPRATELPREFGQGFPCGCPVSVATAPQRAGAPVLWGGQSWGRRDGSLGVRAAQKQRLASLGITLELGFPRAVSGVEPCGNALQ